MECKIGKGIMTCPESQIEDEIKYIASLKYHFRNYPKRQSHYLEYLNVIEKKLIELDDAMYDAWESSMGEDL